MSDPPKGRIAIKLSAGPANGKTTIPNPASKLGKRPRSARWGDGSESEPEDQRHGRVKAITGFDSDGAETATKRSRAGTEKKSYVIERLPNRDWRDAQGSRKRGKPPPGEEGRSENDTTERAPADQDTGIKWGLTVKEKAANNTEDANDDDPTQTRPTNGSPNQQQQRKAPGDKTPEPTPATADEQALAALLGQNTTKTPAVIIHPTEDDAYEQAIRAAGQASTLADYEAMPVEEFGAALLRGMGWNGEDRGVKPKDVKRRPNQLGLGAKELKGDEDLGAWNQLGGHQKKKKMGPPRAPRLDEYRREEAKRKEARRKRYDDEDRGHRDRDRDRDRDREDRDRRDGQRNGDGRDEYKSRHRPHDSDHNRHRNGDRRNGDSRR